MQRGSNGFGEERYVAYLPFEIALGATIATPATLTIEGIQTRLEHFGHIYALMSGPLPTANAAAEQIHKLRAAVGWLALEFRVGIKAEKEIGEIVPFNPPASVATNPNFAFLAGTGWDHIDGHYEAERAVVIPDHKRFVRFEVGRASVNIGINAANWAEKFQHALTRPNILTAGQDDRLQLAIDLYAESRALIIPRTQLITLITALESLLPGSEIAANALAVLEQLKQISRDARNATAADSLEWKALNSLFNRVGELKRTSIGSSLRELVLTSATKHPELGESVVLARTVMTIYQTRSELVHNGIANSPDIAAGLTFLNDFVPQLLRALFLDASANP